MTNGVTNDLTSALLRLRITIPIVMQTVKLAKKRTSTDRTMYREGAGGERFPIQISGTCLGAAYENTT